MEVVYQAYVYLSTTLDGFAGPMDISYQDFVDSLGDQSVDSGWSMFTKRFNIFYTRMGLTKCAFSRDNIIKFDL